MSGEAQRADRGDPDLIDRIAKELPADIRADYYREMMHCRSLPESDEMLRILGLTTGPPDFETFLSFVHPNDRARVAEANSQAIGRRHAASRHPGSSRPGGSG